MRDYNNKKVFIGIDVHKKSYAVCAVCEDITVKKWSTAAEPHKLGKSLKSMFPGAFISAVYEAGFSGYGLLRSLETEGISCIIINPASLQSSAKDRVKTDKKDARKLAIQLSKGILQGICIPNEKRQMLREISRVRDQVSRTRSRVIIQIKMKLHYFGIADKDDNRKMSNKFLKQIEARELPEELRISFSILADQWRLLTKQIYELRKKIIQCLDSMPRERDILLSVPGISYISASIILFELGDMAKRFKNERQLFSYTGLTPSEFSSGESIRKGTITRCGPARVRWILTEIAWVSISKDRSLREIYERIKIRRGSKRAIVAVARRLLGRIRSCFKSDQEYRYESL